MNIVQNWDQELEAALYQAHSGLPGNEPEVRRIRRDAVDRDLPRLMATGSPLHWR